MRWTGKPLSWRNDHWPSFQGETLIRANISLGESDFAMSMSFIEASCCRSLGQTVNLPVGPDSPYKSTNAIADVFVGLDLESTLSQEIEIFCNANKLAYRQLQCINVVQSSIRIGTFFAEWKKDDVDAVRCQGAYNALAIQRRSISKTVPFMVLS